MEHQLTQQDILNWVMIILTVGALAIGLISMAVGQIARFWDWLIDWRPVKHSQDSDDDIMSHSAVDDVPVVPLSQRQTEAQTHRQPMLPMPSRDVMLNTYKTLRKYGMPREEARVMLKSMGLPLDNNQWTQAAPTDDEPTVLTPIARRPTKASYYQDDPELTYQPPS